MIGTLGFIEQNYMENRGRSRERVKRRWVERRPSYEWSQIL
jgi:hypothetical protein